jgi:hypothetical protein
MIYSQGIAIVRLEVLMIICLALVVLFFAGPELGRIPPPASTVYTAPESQG